MTSLAPILQGFFTDRLAQRRASAAHRRRLPRHLPATAHYAQQRTGKAPSALALTDLDAALDRRLPRPPAKPNAATASTTRNARLAAIHSLFRYAARAAPSTPCSSSGCWPSPPPATPHRRLLPHPRGDRRPTCRPRPHQLARPARPPDASDRRPNRTAGLRTHRAHLRRRRTRRRAAPRCPGKGRKQRCTPLTTSTARLLRQWLTERGAAPTDPLFPARLGGHLSRDAIADLLAKYLPIAAANCPTLASKKITPHTLRHYVDGWVMWPVGVFPLVGVPRAPVPAT